MKIRKRWLLILSILLFLILLILILVLWLTSNTTPPGFQSINIDTAHLGTVTTYAYTFTPKYTNYNVYLPNDASLAITLPPLTQNKGIMFNLSITRMDDAKDSLLFFNSNGTSAKQLKFINTILFQNNMQITNDGIEDWFWSTAPIN